MWGRKRERELNFKKLRRQGFSTIVLHFPVMVWGGDREREVGAFQGWGLVGLCKQGVGDGEPLLVC